LSLTFVGTAPAQATPPEPHTSTALKAPTLSTSAVDPEARGGVLTPMFSESGCGFLQRCLYFTRSEQLIILAGGGATIVALICGATALLGCAAASGLVAAVF
jgi:hypothetical protein